MVTGHRVSRRVGCTSVVRAVFVYPNSRAALLERVHAGVEPDSTLLGLNHLAEHGVDARLHDPLLTRRSHGALLDRLAWNARELTLPLELGRADIAFTPLAALFPLAARTKRLPVVVVNYGLNLIWRRASTPRRRLLRASLRAAARVICLGESQRRELIELAGLDEEQVTTLLLPVDERYFVPGEQAAGSLVVSVGKDLARDFVTLAEAVGGLEAEAVLVAHPRNLAGVGLPANARVAQGLPSDELRSLYARAGCVVVAQHRDGHRYGSEGGGLTALLEAMAMGRAVVATERGVLRDYATDGVDALLVPPADPAAMREAIVRVLGDADLAARLGAAARARVERAHTTRGFAASLAPLFREVVLRGTENQAER